MPEVIRKCSTSYISQSLTIAEYLVYSYPHNAGRPEGMDPGCWEIKWENRNDCLTALAVSNTFPHCEGLIFLVQTLRSVPHLTVTWPNQPHALMPRRTGIFNRSHHVKDHLAGKRQPGPQQGQLHCDNDHNVTGQIFAPLDSASSWKHSANTAVVAVGSQALSEHISPSNNSGAPTSTDDWTIVDACVNGVFQVLPTEDSREKQGDGALCPDGVPPSQLSNLLEWSEVVSDPAKGEVATLSPS